MTGQSHGVMVVPRSLDSLRGAGGGGHGGGHHDGVVSDDHSSRAVVHADDIIAAWLHLCTATQTPHGSLGEENKINILVRIDLCHSILINYLVKKKHIHLCFCFI